MEDLIEEIIGDIEDEYDKEESIIIQIYENNFYIKGNFTVSDFNNEFNSNLEVGEYDTINGYLLTVLDKIPDEGTLLSSIRKFNNKKQHIFYIISNRCCFFMK